MKQIAFVFLVAALSVFGNVFAYAASSFEITSDFDFSTEKVSTFDEEKTISGMAPAGTVIEISVSAKKTGGTYRQTQYYAIEVGSSEIFSQVVDLSLGENIVEFNASFNDQILFEESSYVNRKNKAIKVQLESGIYIPGGSK